MTTARAAAAALLLGTGAAFAAENPMVGGAPMFADRNIVENAVTSADHTTLVAAVQAAELVDALQGPGPMTVFAPVNAAFDRLPEGTVETLLEPGNQPMLQRILTSHVVAGNLSGAEIMRRARASSDGFFHMETLSGAPLSAQVRGGSLWIHDQSGNAGRVTISDVNQSNGVIHVVNRVLLPR
ncbi:MAG: fasciclin domain-containing protein [Rhodobacteraceae bacterium]|nr:fasciclin domain-containing protein [Paracoccaceae bacterium]